MRKRTDRRGEKLSDQCGQEMLSVGTRVLTDKRRIKGMVREHPDHPDFLKARRAEIRKGRGRLC